MESRTTSSVMTIVDILSIQSGVPCDHLATVTWMQTEAGASGAVANARPIRFPIENIQIFKKSLAHPLFLC